MNKNRSNYAYLLILLIFTACTQIDKKNMKLCVATVNNEPITIDEFNRFMNQNRASVYNYFSQNYNVQDVKEFWTTDFDGKKPVRYLKEKTLNESVKIKIQQILAREKGLIQDISYASFLNRLKRENKKRQLAVKTKKVIYGPIHFTEQTYFNHTFSALMIELKRELAAHEFDLSDENLRRFYESHKDDLYKQQDALKVEKLSVAVENEKERKRVATLLQHRLKSTQTDGPLNEIAASRGLPTRYEIMNFNASTAHLDEQLNFEIKNAAMKLHPGEFCTVDADDSVHIIKCMERKNGGYLPLEQIRHIVEVNYIDKCYDKLVEKRIQDAKVEVNTSVYDSIVVL